MKIKGVNLVSDKITYRDMQLKAYEEYSSDFNIAKNICVGWWDAHEKYPYEQYLLEEFGDKPRFSALDFGCGIGRMIKRMDSLFAEGVDGVDLCAKNLEHAKRYLEPEYTGWLMRSDGLSCGPLHIDCEWYSFIYSTLCLQHICVHEIRHQILKDFYTLLANNGQCCIQLGYGWDNDIHWNDNFYEAEGTNSANDVSIPNENYFELIENDLKDIGFTNIKFKIKESPHPDLMNYHPNWLFIYMDKT